MSTVCPVLKAHNDAIKSLQEAKKFRDKGLDKSRKDFLERGTRLIENLSHETNDLSDRQCEGAHLCLMRIHQEHVNICRKLNREYLQNEMFITAMWMRQEATCPK